MEPQAMIVNRTYDEIQLGDTVTLEHTVTDHDIQLFGIVSGDVNPVHFDAAYAKNTRFGARIIHGGWNATLFSNLLGMQIPGPGAIYVSQTLQFRRPIYLGDTITAAVRVIEKTDQNRSIKFVCSCTNQHGKVVTTGEAVVIAPTEKINFPRPRLPEVPFGS